MSVLELVFMAIALAALCLAVLVLLGARRNSQPLPQEAVVRSLADLGAIKAQVENFTQQQAALGQTIGTLHQAVRGVETRVLESSSGVKDSIGRQLQEAQMAVERLKGDAEARVRREEEVQASARRIEAVLLGSRTRGAAGENILEDAFRQFPADMIETNFRVNGKVVEYALVLANSKRLPIDSKWPSPDLIDRLGQAESDPAEEAAVVLEVERLLRGKVREVKQYIDPACTLAFAIAAVPDAVFNACRRAHIEAYREGVILMPYSMTVPYVLALFRLHLQYARSIDLENLEGYLQVLEENVTALDRSLENSVSRGSTMIQNAFNDCKRNLGQMRGALAALRAIPQTATGQSSQPPLSVIEGEAEPAIALPRGRVS
jgi:DNA recombination protein RmuC